MPTDSYRVLPQAHDLDPKSELSCASRGPDRAKPVPRSLIAEDPGRVRAVSGGKQRGGVPGRHGGDAASGLARAVAPCVGALAGDPKDPRETGALDQARPLAASSFPRIRPRTATGRRNADPARRPGVRDVPGRLRRKPPTGPNTAAGSPAPATVPPFRTRRGPGGAVGGRLVPRAGTGGGEKPGSSRGRNRLGAGRRRPPPDS